MRTVTRPLAVALAAAVASGCGVAKYDDVQRPAEPTVVVSPPVISQAPEKLTKDRAAAFAFAAADATVPVTFRCKLDGGELSACTSGVRYEALGDGAHSFTVEAVDAAGGGHPATYGWTVDGTAPAVSITGQPDPVWASTTATFAFAAPDATGASFRCSLDGGQPAECQSGATYGPLGDGEHRFVVEATDPLGNATVAATAWTVDATGPTIDATGPASLIATGNAAFTFSGTDPSAPVKFWCSLDTGALEPCVSGQQYTVADGPHAFTLEAADTLGNVSRWQRGWTVDTTPPVVTLSVKPDAVTRSTSAQLEFSATDVGGGVSFGCKLDDGGSVSCTSPRAYTVAEGTHTFTVTAFDPAGNSSEVSHTWTVDTTGPALAFKATPPRSSNDSNARFEFTASDLHGPVTVTCTLEHRASTGAGAETDVWYLDRVMTPCASPVSLVGVETGAHRFTVRAEDAVGNVSTLASTWTVHSVNFGGDCGDLMLQQFEGCDDGETLPGDGCSGLCRVELDNINRTPIVTVDTSGVPWMAVTPSGTIYLRQSGVGRAPDSFLKVIPGDPVVVTTDAVPGVLGWSGGDVIAIGEDLVFVSSAQDGKTGYVQKWTAIANTTATLFQFATDSAVQSFAVNAAQDRAFHAGSAGPISKAIGPSASASFWPGSVSELLYDRAGDRLYVVSDGALKVDATGGAGSAGSFSDLYWNPDLRDIAVDAYGMIYGACYSIDPATSGRVPCSTGALVAIKLDPSSDTVTMAPIVEPIRAIDRVVYEPVSNALFLSTSEQVPGSATVRTSVWRMRVAVPP